VVARPEEPPSGPDSLDSRVSIAIYDALLREIYRGQVPSVNVVESISLGVPWLDDLDWPAVLSGVPSPLRGLVRLPESQHPVVLRDESFPPGTRLIDRAGPDDRLYTSLSRVFVSGEGLDALVYSHHVFGTLCAKGTLGWLQHGTTASKATLAADKPRPDR
jgi:hypothetical protein